MKSMLRDLRLGTGLLARDRTFTIVALATLAIAIGANAAIFSVVNAVLLRPLPYPEPERLVMLYNQYPNVGVIKGSNGVPDYFDRRQLTGVFAELALVEFPGSNIGAEGSPERVRAARTTRTLLPLLGVEPALGRNFTPEETDEGGNRVVILSHGLWRRTLGGDPGAVGREMRIDGLAHRIVGVLPKGFDLFDRGVQLLVPFAFTPEQKSDDARHSNFATMIGRLAPGVTPEQAQERIDALNRQISERLPYRDLLANAGFRTAVVGMQEEMVSEVRPMLYLLQAGVAFVLLIGCVNVANLMLVRSNRRLKELAIRFALGAGRLRVARQLLTESLVLGLAGGGLGLLLAAAGTEALSAFGVDELPRGTTVGLDATVLAFTLGLALATGLAFGLIPVVHVLRSDLADVFRRSGRSSSQGRNAVLTRGALVVAQLSLAFVLLAGAGLMLLSFGRVLRQDPGFAPAGVLTARLYLPAARYGDIPEIRGFAAEALAALRSLPGVEAAGLTTSLPLSGDLTSSVITVEGYTLAAGESPPVPHWAHVDPGYFAALGIPLLRGRLLERTDSADSLPVALVDRQLASRYWPDGDALDKRILRGLADESDEPVWFTVVGVVGNVRTTDLADPDAVGSVYFPFEQRPQRNFHLVLRTAGGGGLSDRVRGEILGLDPELPLYDVKSMDLRVAESLLERRAPMMLLVLFAGVALLLAAVGIYGVLAYAVAQRTREIGIRSALGARPGGVLGMVLAQGAKLVGAGLALGLAGALALSRLLASFLYEVEPTDPAVLATIAGLLAAVALVACLAPALRAARVDPVVALREE